MPEPANSDHGAAERPDPISRVQPTRRDAQQRREQEQPSLEQLMARYLAGEVAAFDEIYRRTAHRVLGFHMLMTKSRAQAEDLTQTTFLKLHRARAGWIPGAAVAPWLMAIARNAFLDHARRVKRARVRLTHTGSLPDRVDGRTMAPPNVGLKEAIDSAIADLSPLQREAFILTRHSGLSSRDAAQVLGTSETAVKLRVHRAYVALRGALSGHRQEPT